jgi:hypothetical protein
MLWQLTQCSISAVMCLAWLGRRWWRERKRMMMDEGPQGPTDWEIDMGDIKCVVPSWSHSF